jgi:hypothetical protein
VANPSARHRSSLKARLKFGCQIPSVLEGADFDFKGRIINLEVVGTFQS